MRRPSGQTDPDTSAAGQTPAPIQTMRRRGDSAWCRHGRTVRRDRTALHRPTGVAGTRTPEAAAHAAGRRTRACGSERPQPHLDHTRAERSPKTPLRRAVVIG